MRKLYNSKTETNIKPEVLKITDEKQIKSLFLVMQKVYFDEIECGNKKVEYRDDSDFYISRLCTKDNSGKITGIKNYKTVLLQEGYNPGARRMTVEILDIKYDRYDGFEIYLGEILSRENFDRTNAPKRAKSDPTKPKQPKKKKVVKTQLEIAKLRKNNMLNRHARGK